MSYTSEVLADSPVAYYRLGEASGTSAADSSGNSRTGTYVGSPVLGIAGAIAGDADTAINGLSGSNYVTAPSSVQVGTGSAYSLECWCKFTGTGSNQFVVAEGRVASATPIVALRCDSGKFGGFLRDDAALNKAFSGATLFNDGNYHHVVLVRDASGWTIYVDGNSDGSIAVGTFGTVTLDTAAIGARLTSTAQNPAIAQTVDEVAWYSTALSAGRIATHYSVGIGGGGGSPAVQQSLGLVGVGS